MDIKYIHVILIVVSIALCLGFGFWTLSHSYLASAFGSFAVAAALIIYCIKFIQKMRTL